MFSRSSHVMSPGYLVLFAALLPLAAGCNRFEKASKASANGEQRKSKSQEAEEHQLQGLALAKEGKLDDAIEQYTLAIDIDPLHSQAYLARGKAFVAKGFPDLGVDDFTSSLRITPGVHDAVLSRAEAQLTLKRPNEAIDDARLAVRLNPRSAASYDALGTSYVESRGHYYDLAIAAFQEATRLDPQLAAKANTQIAQAFFDSAVHLDRQGESAEAQRAFAEAEQRDPKFTLAHEQYQQARTALRSTDVQRYEVGYRGGIRQATQPDAKTLELVEQAKAMFEAKDYDNAIERYTEALRLDSRLGDAWFGRGQAFLAQGFPDTAVDDLNVAINFTNKPAEVLLERGRAYAAMGKQYIAIQDFTDAIRRKPAFVQAYFDRGKAHLASRSYDRALADFNETVKRDPERTAVITPLIADVYRGRAQDKLIGEDFAGALADVNESIRLQPKDASSYGLRGIVYSREGKWSTAMANYQRAIQLDPDRERFRLRDQIEIAEQNLAASAQAR
jgi:tetratricopeptide (TPR) repeat protein